MFYLGKLLQVSGMGERKWMFYLGKLLQVSGMVTVIWAFVVGVWGGDSQGELMLLGLGATVFLLGVLVLRRSRPS